MAGFVLFDSLTSKEQYDIITAPSYSTIVRIELNDEDGIPRRNIIGEVLEGSINKVLKNGVRRTTDFTIKNFSTNLIPSDVDSLIYFDKSMTLYVGMRVNGVDYFAKQGLFKFSNPTFTTSPSSNTMSITCWDFWCLLDGSLNGNLRYGYEIPVGSNIGVALRGILSQAGFDGTKAFINPNLSSKNLQASIRTGNKTTYSDILIKTSEKYSQVCYVDTDGLPVFEDPPSQTDREPVWNFNTSDNIIQGGIEHNYSQMEVYNAVVINSQNNQTGAFLSGYAQDDDPSSPTFVGDIGIKQAPVIDNNDITTQAEADLYAKYWLLRYKDAYQTISFSCTPIPFLSEGDLVTVTDEKSGANRDLYIITQISYNFITGGLMQLSLTKARTQEDIILL